MSITNCGEIQSTQLSSGGYDPGHFSQLAALEERNFWFCPRNNLIIWAIGKWANVNDRFFEIGCGTGFVLQAIAKRFPSMYQTGGELFPDALEFARARVPNAHLFNCDVRKMYFPSEFNCIGAFDVLEHIDDDIVAINNLYMALCPGGLLLITVPQHSWLWSPSDEMVGHCRRYEPGQLESQLRQAGLIIVRSTSFVFLLLPLMFLSRLWQRIVRPNFNVLSELQLPTAVSWIFTLVLRLEISAIKSGINFPIGGSRFVVARKPYRVKQSDKVDRADEL